MYSETNQSVGRKEPFHLVPRRSIGRLLKSLATHGSEALTVHRVIETLLDWWEKNDDYRCIALAPEDGDDDGVCVLILEEYKCKRLLLFAPEAKTTEFLSCLEATNLIPWGSMDFVSRLTKRLTGPVAKILEEKGCQVSFGYWYHLMMLAPENALSLEENETPENVQLRELTEENSSILAANWKCTFDDGFFRIRDGIKYNGALGAVDEDGKLVAWILWNHWGDLGLLYVSPSHRRLGLGRLLTVRMTKKVAEKGLTVTAEIETSNESSLRLFRSLGFRSVHLERHVALSGYKFPGCE